MAASTSPNQTPPPQQGRPRLARGQSRPQYLASGDLDRVFIMLMTLATEVSALRDRIDTHEALAEAGIPATQAAVETFAVDESRETARVAWRDGMLDRLLRVVTEEMDHHGRERADSPAED